MQPIIGSAAFILAFELFETGYCCLNEEGIDAYATGSLTVGIIMGPLQLLELAGWQTLANPPDSESRGENSLSSAETGSNGATKFQGSPSPETIFKPNKSAMVVAEASIAVN